MATSQDHLKSRSDFLIDKLNLTYLDKESGYIGILDRSPHWVVPLTSYEVENPKPTSQIKPLAAQSHNYYMLTSEYPINYLHLLEPDDNHVLIEGGPVEYYIFTPANHPSLKSHIDCPQAKKIILGREYDKDQIPIISIPGGCYKALRLCKGAEYALMANILAPEFTEDRVKIGGSKEFVEMFKEKAEWADEKFLKDLIGNENWT